MSLLFKDVVPKLLSSTQRRNIYRLWFLLLTITALYSFIGSSPAIASPTAKTYYVAPNGNDNNAGTIDKPWRHISYATTNNIVKPGDTVLVRGGTYVEYIPQEISGSQGNYITYRNYPGETPIITDGSDERSWRWQVVDQSYVRIEGFTFSNFEGGAIQIRARDINMSHIDVINNSFKNQKMDGSQSSKTVYVTTSTDDHSIHTVLIQGNLFQDLNTGTSKANEALMVSGTVSKVAILDNTVFDVTNIGIDIAGRPDKGQPSQILIKGNEVYNYGTAITVAGGIYLDGAGSQIVIENNIVHDGPKGIHVNLEEAAKSLTTKHVIVRNNILYNNSINLKLGVAGANDKCRDFGHLTKSVAIHNTIYSNGNNTANHYFSCGENLRWKNNIFVHQSANDGAQYKLVNETANPSSWITDHNLFHNNGNIANYYHWDEKRYSGLVQFQSNVKHELNSLEGDPQFVNVAQQDFSLQSNSPARNNGGALSWTRGAGSGTVIPVTEAWYFSDGMGVQPGDMIRIGGNSAARVLEVDYSNHLITVNTAVSWNDQAPINYDYSGNGPDIGATEFNPFLSFSAIPQDQALLLQWNVDQTLSANTQWVIEYGKMGQATETINLDANDRSLRLDSLENYQVYTIKLSAVEGEQMLWTQTIQAMPTDIFFYLPMITS